MDLSRAPFPWRNTYVKGPELASLFQAFAAYSGRWYSGWSGRLESTPDPWASECSTVLLLDDGPHKSSWSTGYSYDALVDCFIEYERLKARRRRGAELAPAPLVEWREPKALSAIVEKLRWLGIRTPEQLQMRPHDFRRAVGSVVAECSLFRPQTAKALYDVLANGAVLDPCAGWGCRALGALASKRVTSYIGYDPNRGLQVGHDAMLKFFGSMTTEKPVRIHYEPFETAALEANSVSLVLTSPPYFDLEIYGQASPGQSVHGQTFESWKSIWLKAFVDLSAYALMPGGYFAVHLNDSPGAPNVRALFELVDSNGTLERCAPLGILGPKGQARPVWIWKKTR